MIATAIQCHVRWIIQNDMEKVMHIENVCYPEPWTEQEFRNTLRGKNCVGLVAEVHGHVAGYCLYWLQKGKLQIINLAVDPHYQRSGVATALVKKLKSKLFPNLRNKITIIVRESALSCQMFLKAMGFVAVEVLRGQYDDTGEDGYLMEYIPHDERAGQMGR